MENATLTIVETITPSTALRWTAKSFAGTTAVELQTLGWKLNKQNILTMTRPPDTKIYLEGLLREGIIATVLVPSDWDRLRTYLVLYQKYADAWAKTSKFRDEILIPMVAELGNDVEEQEGIKVMDIEGWQIGVYANADGQLEYSQKCILSNVCDNCGVSDRINTQHICELCGTKNHPYTKFTPKRALADTLLPTEHSIGDFPKLKVCANLYCEDGDTLHPPEDLSPSTGDCPKCWVNHVAAKQDEV